MKKQIRAMVAAALIGLGGTALAQGAGGAGSAGGGSNTGMSGSSTDTGANGRSGTGTGTIGSH